MSLISEIVNLIEQEAEGETVLSKDRIVQLLKEKALEAEKKEANNILSHGTEESPAEDIEAINRTKVLWSIKEVPLPNPEDDIDDGEGATGPDGEPKKKKNRKKDGHLKKNRNDPNAPALTRIPMPELRDTEASVRRNILAASKARLRLSSNQMPSIMFFTLLNGSDAVCCEISDDTRLLAVGFSTGVVRVWSVTKGSLRKMKDGPELEEVDKDGDKVYVDLLSNQDFKHFTFKGHSGPVYSTSFSLDNSLLLSSSADGSIRLWSLYTWTCLCVYKGHLSPVWSTVFAPCGYYFASSSNDRSARLWATDNVNPLRVFVGHYNDVDVCLIHPNSNYVATAAADGSIRLWDVLNGDCVRYWKGHKGRIITLFFSHCGRFLIAAGTDKAIYICEMGSGVVIYKLLAHHDDVYTVTLSRDNTILATGGADDCVNLWDFKKLINEVDLDDLLGTSRFPLLKQSSDPLFLGSFRTKSTNIMTLHFSRKNVLVASGIVH